MLGLDAAEKQFPFLDKTRECVLGTSYGGFMANKTVSNWCDRWTHTNAYAAH